MSKTFRTLVTFGLLFVALPGCVLGADVISIWGGARETMILKSDGTVWDWGLNTYGHLGDGTISSTSDPTNDKHVPIEVHGPGNIGYLNSIIAIMGGESHNVALKSDGTVWAWGQGSLANSIGDGTNLDRLTPVQVSNLSSIVSLGGRTYHTLAIKSDGTIWGWGFNSSGQLGNGTTSPTFVPVQVLGLPTNSSPISVSAGYTYSVALMSNGTVWAWGTGGNGELGNGATGHSYAPVQAVGLSNITAISTGWKHTLALKSDGTVWTWGKNTSGELGDGTVVSRSAPVQVLEVSNIVAVTGGDYHSSALKSDGTVWKWGLNDVGELGMGTTNSLPNPVPAMIPGLSNVVKLSARDYHNIALKSDGSVWMWGANDHGQCGINTTNDVWSPMQIPGLGVRVALPLNGKKSAQPGSLDFSWNSAAGEYFSVETSTDLKNWAAVQANIPATPPVNTVTVDATNDHAFFRLKF